MGGLLGHISQEDKEWMEREGITFFSEKGKIKRKKITEDSIFKKLDEIEREIQKAEKELSQLKWTRRRLRAKVGIPG